MPSDPAGLYCDEDVSVVLAAMLRARGFRVTTTRDAGYLGRTDEQQLHVAADSNLILLTHNRADFQRLHHEWLESGRRHSGIIIARRRLPRELTLRLGRLLGRLTADDFMNQLFYA
jgi:hypothetical protein